MLYSWDRLNKIGPIKNNRLSVQIGYISKLWTNVKTAGYMLHPAVFWGPSFGLCLAFGRTVVFQT